MDALIRLVSERLKNPIGFMVAIIAGIGAILGSLKSAYEFFITLPAPWGWFIAVCISLASLITAIIFISIINFRRTYRIPLEQRYIFTDVTQSCHIQSDGLRNFTQSKTYFFFRPPKPEDFFDNQLSSRELDFADLKYSSKDSKVIGVDKISDTLFKVSWEPINTEIEIGAPYTHIFDCTYPRQKISYENVNFITFATSGFIKKVHLTVTSDKKIVKTVAYKKRFGQSLKNADKIVDFAKKVRSTEAPPVKRLDEKSIEWEHEDITSGDIYFVVVFLGGSNIE